jgi:eukaryotic-like serine/threonine-protein kinase
MAREDRVPSSGGNETVRLGKYELLPGEPLDELRSAHTEAVRAVDPGRMSDSLFALLCDPEFPPRLDLAESVAVLRPEGLMTPVAWGVVDWPQSSRGRFALVFDQPGGSRVAKSLTDKITPFPEEEILAGVLPGFVATMRRFLSVGHTHRAIRPTNLFFRAAAGDWNVLLGECVTTPPGLMQPKAYETIESMLTQPAGRGPGSAADDLYAFGVTLMFLLLGHDPSAGMTDEQLLEEKMRRGTYVTLLGEARLPPRVSEAVRGLVADDQRERWALRDLEAWTAGRRLAPKQFVPPRRATRLFEFGGIGHATARSIAATLAADPQAAAGLLRTQEFEAWLQHGLGDADLTAAVTKMVADKPDTESSTHEERLVARALIVLDPLAPIRLSGLAVTVDGFGPVLAAAFRQEGALAPIADAINGRLPQFWFANQGSFRPEFAPRLKVFDKMRLHLEDRRPGFGLERILYELNSGLHCIAPSIEMENVMTAHDLLAVLERAAVAGRLGERIVERHVAAFVAARFRNAGTDWHELLASGEPHTRALGTLMVLARLQAQYGPPLAPALGERLGRELPPLLERFHSHTRRMRLRGELARLSGRGALVEMLNIIAGPAEQSRDAADFRAAQGEFGSIEHELAVLAADAELRPRQAEELGGRLGVTVATVLATVAGLCAIFAAG